MSRKKEQYLTVEIWHLFLNKSISYDTAYVYKKNWAQVWRESEKN